MLRSTNSATKVMAYIITNRELKLYSLNRLNFLHLLPSSTTIRFRYPAYTIVIFTLVHLHFPAPPPTSYTFHYALKPYPEPTPAFTPSDSGLSNKLLS